MNYLFGVKGKFWCVFKGYKLFFFFFQDVRGSVINLQEFEHMVINVSRQRYYMQK